MEYYINKNPDSMGDILLGTCEYGNIYCKNNKLYIPYSNKGTYVYDYYAKMWNKLESKSIVCNAKVDAVNYKDLLVKDNVLFEILAADILEHYTTRRNNICFPIVNRGTVWYNHLTYAQKQELNEWYEQWLDVTETLKEPDKPTWLDDKIVKLENTEVIL